MSEENVKAVRDAAAAFNRGDLDTWSEFWTDDIDYRAIEGAIDDHGSIHGKAAVRAYVQDWLDNFDNFRSEAGRAPRRRGRHRHRRCEDQRARKAERN